MADSMTMDPADTVPETEEATPHPLRDQTKKVKEDLRELGRIGREVSQEKLGKVRETTGEYLEKGRQRATEVEDSVVTYVREKPVKSLAMAIGAGAILGYLLRRH